MLNAFRRELNYKEAYLLLFNKLTDIENEIIEIKLLAEEIAIKEIPYEFNDN